jgi:D-aminopeptidase
LKSVLALLFAASVVSGAPRGEERKRARELGIELGVLAPGPGNAITDVEGVLVGHESLVEGESVRTGVTVVLPRKDVWDRLVPASAFVLNGNGQLTGMPWIEESELLGFPIVLTNSASVGQAYDAVIEYVFRRDPERRAGLQAVVAECWDGTLNDIRGRAIRSEHVFRAIESASGGPVAEGAVGAGVGMVSYGFKGGIGTSSRKLASEQGGYTVGALVLTNHGSREQLVVNGRPVGRGIRDLLPEIHEGSGGGGNSIIMVVATDAPLTARALQRLARRATLGLARTGSTAHASSGDIAIAFSTARSFDRLGGELLEIRTIDPRELDPLFDAAAEATEEAIVNSLTMAATTTGFRGNRVHGVPLDRLVELVN